MLEKTKLIKNILLAFSFANLTLLAEWLNFLGTSNFSMGRYELAIHSASSYPALLCCLLILAVAFYILLTLIERSRSNFIKTFLGLLCTSSLIFPINALRLELPNPEYLSIFGLKAFLTGTSSVSIVLILGTFFLVLFCLYLRTKQFPHLNISKIGERVAYICIPIIFITCGNLLWIWKGETKDKSQGQQVHSKNSNRVVWIIFDEWDQRLSFKERPNTLQLPQFEKIKNAGLSFENSYPPGRNTIESIPSLIIGRKTLVHQFESDDLLLSAPNQKLSHWSQEENIFSFAKRNGNSTAIAGWFHRYCDVFKKDLDLCHRNSRLRFDYSNYFFKNISLILNRTVSFRHRNTKIHIDDFDSLLEQTKLFSANKNLDLVFVHLPVPHGPFIFDRINNKMNPAKTQNPDGYLDNLALADAAMGEIRRAMEESGTWDKTTLILSADHSWRDSTHYDGKHDFRVPFIIKMPDSQKKVETATYSTLLSFNFIKEVLKGQIDTTDEASNFFKKHSKEFSPELNPALDPKLSSLAHY